MIRINKEQKTVSKNDKETDEIKARLKIDIETERYINEDILFFYGVEYAKIIIGNIDKE